MNTCSSVCVYVCMCVPILLSAFLTRLHSPEETCSISHAKAVSSFACVVLLSQVLWHQVGCKHVLQVPETAESSLCLKQSDWQNWCKMQGESKYCSVGQCPHTVSPLFLIKVQGSCWKLCPSIKCTICRDLITTTLQQSLRWLLDFLQQQ